MTTPKAYFLGARRLVVAVAVEAGVGVLVSGLAFRFLGSMISNVWQ